MNRTDSSGGVVDVQRVDANERSTLIFEVDGCALGEEGVSLDIKPKILPLNSPPFGKSISKSNLTLFSANAFCIRVVALKSVEILDKSLI